LVWAADAEHNRGNRCQRDGVDESPCGVGDGEQDADDDARDEVADAVDESEEADAVGVADPLDGSQRGGLAPIEERKPGSAAVGISWPVSESRLPRPMPSTLRLCST
jgi:hypothetical protein